MSAVMDLQLADLHWDEHGCATLSGALFEWSLALDRFVRERAQAAGATDYRFPSLISAQALAPVAYLRSFPHLATFVTAGRRDALQDVARQHGSAVHVPMNPDCFEDATHLLLPAACYHCYPMLAGRQLSAPLLLTMRCQCFRRETHYLPLQRQWSFEMREVVCIGGAATIAGFCDDWRDGIDRLLAALGITAAWRTATDPFFDPARDPKALAQLIEPTKLELRTAAGLAIASVNRHRRFFGESYDIRIGDKDAESACVAFGIERWLHAMMETHGSNVDKWPTPGAIA